MVVQARQPVIILSDPESKISFLEQTLIGKDWRAVLVFDPRTGLDPATLPTLSETLKNRGYTVKQGADSLGTPILSIHHLGKETSISAAFNEAGVGRGVLHTITHPFRAFRKPIDYANRGLHWLIGSLHDPARANGVINTTAEMFLISAGKGAQYGKFSDPKNALLSGAGLSWFGQSLTYLIFGKNNEQRAYDRIAKKLEQTAQAGGDITQLRFDVQKDRDPQGPLATARAFMYRFTVPIGAMLNNLGMVAYIGQAVLERKYRKNLLLANPNDVEAVKYVGKEVKNFGQWIKTGFGKDIFGASLSLAGWTTLMIPPKAPRTESELAAEKTSVVGSWWEKFREHTPTLAGLFTLGASSFRLMGAQSRDNKIQAIGEKIYLGGDVALMFTNSHEYGGDKKLDPERLSDKILDYIGRQPVLLGATNQKDFVNNTVQYWLDKNKADTENNRFSRRVPRKIVEESAVEIRQVLTRKLAHMQNERFEHLCECAAEIIARFDEPNRPALSERLSKALADLPWTRITEAEMKTGIDHALTKLPPVKERPLNLKLIANDAKAISAIVPGVDDAMNAAAIYDAVAPFVKSLAPLQRPHFFAHGADRNTHPSTQLAASDISHVAKGVEAANEVAAQLVANAR